MEDNPFGNAINSTENCWMSNGPKTSSATSQHMFVLHFHLHKIYMFVLYFHLHKINIIKLLQTIAY